MQRTYVLSRTIAVPLTAASRVPEDAHASINIGGMNSPTGPHVKHATYHRPDRNPKRSASEPFEPPPVKLQRIDVTASKHRLGMRLTGRRVT